ncbi:MAG: hypothetical protein AAGK66_02830 [Pseudomonadota bacterium]
MRVVLMTAVCVALSTNLSGFADERCNSCETADQDLIEAQAQAEQVTVELRAADQNRNSAQASLETANEAIQRAQSQEREVYTRLRVSCTQQHFETVITLDRQFDPQPSYAKSVAQEAQEAVSACMNPTPRCQAPQPVNLPGDAARRARERNEARYQGCLNGGPPNVPYGYTHVYLGYTRNAQKELVRSYYTLNSIEFDRDIPFYSTGSVKAGASAYKTELASSNYVQNESSVSPVVRVFNRSQIPNYFSQVDQGLAAAIAEKDTAADNLKQAEDVYESVLKRHLAAGTRLENARTRAEYCESDEWQSFVAETCQAPSANADSEKLFEMSQAQLNKQCPVAEEYGLSISESCMLANKPVDKDLNAKAREIVAGECKLELDDAAAACLSLRR